MQDKTICWQIILCKNSKKYFLKLVFQNINVENFENKFS